MVSLNDLDAQLAALDNSDEEPSGGEHVVEQLPKKRKLKRKKKDTKVGSDTEIPQEEGTRATRKKVKKSNDAQDAGKVATASHVKLPPSHNSKSELDLESESAPAVPQSSDIVSGTKKNRRRLDQESESAPAVPQSSDIVSGTKKNRRRHGASVCFNYLRGSCTFDDCMFPHVRAAKLTSEERAQVLAELPRKTFDPVLADVIKQLNIPRCKNFHNHGNCQLPAGKCHFWHLTDGNIARWAGFEYWCHYCEKPITSQKQMEEHQDSNMHKRAVLAQDGCIRPQSRGHGSGRGRGYPEGGANESAVRDQRPARGRGRGY